MDSYDVSQLANLAQQISYYQSGGQSPGNRSIDKINTINNTADSIITNVLAVKKQQIDNAKTRAETGKIGAETTAKNIENKPIAESLVTPKVQSTLGLAQQNVPQPAGGFKNWDEFQNSVLGQRQAGIDEATKQALEGQAKYGTMTPTEYGKITYSGLKEAQTQTALVGDPLKKTVGQVMPTMTPDAMVVNFGEGVTKDTPFVIAKQLGDLKNKRENISTLFPVAGLSPLAQQAARNAGMGAFVTEKQARILNQGNLPTPATADEIKDVSKMGTIQSNIDQINTLVKETNHAGIGLGSHFLNYLGQYSPIEGLQTDPKVVELYRLLNDVNNQLIYLYSGKQINESEYQRLKSTFPDPNLNTEAFDVRLNSFAKQFSEYSQAQQKLIGASGRRGIGVNVPPPTVKIQSQQQIIEEPPGPAKARIRAAGGNPVKFANGQSWKWDGKQFLQVTQ